jgi:hypothetical protein
MTTWGKAPRIPNLIISRTLLPGIVVGDISPIWCINYKKKVTFKVTITE